MPADTVAVVTLVIAVFAIFMVAIGWVDVTSNRGRKG